MFYTHAVTARYVHVEVRQLLKGATNGHAEAECAVTLPTGETATLFAKLRSDRAPFWRVVSIDDFEDPFVARALEVVGEDVLCERIATAAALWNVWDSLRAKDSL